MLLQGRLKKCSSIHVRVFLTFLLKSAKVDCNGHPFMRYHFILVASICTSNSYCLLSFLCYICLVTAEVGVYDNQINELVDEGKQYNSLI